MNNVEIAAVFENIAKLLEVKGEIPFKVRAYRQVVPEIKHLPELAHVAAAGQLRTIPGVGQEIEKKIDEMLATGKLEYYEKLLADFPSGFMELLDLPRVGPKLAARFWEELKVGNVADLEEALEDGRVATMPRLGPKTLENLRQSLDYHRTNETSHAPNPRRGYY